ncbi:2'-5'-oligoadenylate synthase 1 [Microcaecilia unicolor]|uniref:2'-5'-oligoadenylate synthase 1-like n=1 Tax=Microcaecilia unicolor TaxID=1415580 RepID=A0A6P7ZNQ6_9AMPH|nr:2'-5'-oligoadenylate synthase 1-like [Microcaecilia unicolor]
MFHHACAACSKANMDLCKAKAKDLDIFISEKLQPNERFLSQMATAVDSVCTFLKENCFKEVQVKGSKVKVLKVVKGGSTGKGTTLKGRSDADLVVFLSCFADYRDQEDNRREIIDEIRKKLEPYKGRGFTVTIEKSKWPNPRVLSFQLKLDNYEDVVECDVLPAYDPLGQVTKDYRPDPRVYSNLLRTCPEGGGFSTCFTELQRDFVKCRPTKVKSLIRLVKYWYKSYFEDKPEVKKLPPKYALELLTIRAWEEDGKKDDENTKFNTAELFRKVLEMVLNYRTLCVYWLKYYDIDFLESQLSKRRPIIMDPADPTGNFGEGYCWAEVARAAEVCMSQPPSVELVITQDNQFLLSVSVSPYTKIQQVKERIQLERGISIDTMSLFLGDQELLSQCTLVQYGIFSSTMLKLKTQGSYCTLL